VGIILGWSLDIVAYVQIQYLLMDCSKICHICTSGLQSYCARWLLFTSVAPVAVGLCPGLVMRDLESSQLC
jgi:hypothetical protein